MNGSYCFICKTEGTETYNFISFRKLLVFSYLAATHALSRRCDVNADCPHTEDEYFSDMNFGACRSCKPWCHRASANDRQIKCKEFCPS